MPNDIDKPIIYEMKLQVSHGVCTEVQEKGVLWRKKRSNRENTETDV